MFPVKLSIVLKRLIILRSYGTFLWGVFVATHILFLAEQSRRDNILAESILNPAYAIGNKERDIIIPNNNTFLWSLIYNNTFV